MHRAAQSRMKLIDSRRHGAGCELLVVEGDSAAQSVAAVRDANTQAVLPLQGKPLNAWRASPDKVAANALYLQLAQAMGWPSPVAVTTDALAARRFERLVLVFDPDADGIHIGALMLLYLKRHVEALFGQQQVVMVRPPCALLRTADAATGEVTESLAYTPDHTRALRTQARNDGALVLAEAVFRGLGSLPPDILRETCVHPATRRADCVTERELQAVIDVFGGR